MKSPLFKPDWRRNKALIYDLYENSTTKEVRKLELWGKPRAIYSNANLSIYSAEDCNARCPFCVEELRPAARGRDLKTQKAKERNDAAYFTALSNVLTALKPLNPSVSITGGEPSLDQRLPQILSLISRHGLRKRTITTNGSGLLIKRDGREVLDLLIEAGISHLNISRAAADYAKNAALMQLKDGLSDDQLCAIAKRAKKRNCRVRLSCVLLKGITDSIRAIVDYLEFARAAGIDNVVFRQLMKADPETCLHSPQFEYSEEKRVDFNSILEELTQSELFEFQKQVLGYYYYVEVWKYKEIDVVFEEADLSFIERQKRVNPGLIYELVFHPNARLCTTWQPWDGDIGPEMGGGF